MRQRTTRRGLHLSAATNRCIQTIIKIFFIVNASFIGSNDRPGLNSTPTGHTMIKSKINVNNPLTVIAIFSMLTEASAAASLPYIDSENQKIYVWFLIVFPSFLITLFFLTLNFNNKTLYTPADFTKEKKHLTTHSYAPNDLNNQSISLNEASTFIFPPAPLPTSKTTSTPETALRFNFRPQTHMGYTPEKPSPLPNTAQTNTSATSQPLAESAELKHLHLIDLNHPAWQLTHENTLGDVMNSYYALTRKPEHKAHPSDIFLLLTMPQTDSLASIQYKSMNESNNPSAFGHSTVITYNTETYQLNCLSSH